MTEYNGERLAIESADALWTALQNLNLTTLDASYRPSVSLAHQSTGTPYTAVLDALRAVLTVIVSVDPWVTHVTSHAQVAQSIIDALCESGETVAYHVARLRRECLSGPALAMRVVADEGTGAFAYAQVLLGGTLGDDGACRVSVDCERVTGAYEGEFSAYVGDAYTPARVGADSWVNLAHAIARHYRLSGTVELSTQGDVRETTFSVAYGDARPVNAPVASEGYALCGGMASHRRDCPDFVACVDATLERGAPRA